MRLLIWQQISHRTLRFSSACRSFFVAPFSYSYIALILRILNMEEEKIWRIVREKRDEQKFARRPQRRQQMARRTFLLLAAISALNVISELVSTSPQMSLANSYQLLIILCQFSSPNSYMRLLGNCTNCILVVCIDFARCRKRHSL